MGYSVNLGSWRAVFLVPSEVVDKHIKLVGSIQLKVLLWILRNTDKEFCENDVANALSLHEEDVKDSIRYWIETGILKFDGKVFSPGEHDKEGQSQDKKVEQEQEPSFDLPLEASQADKSDKKDKPPQTVARSVKIDMSYISQMINSSKEIAFLMQESQVILGRPISNGDQSTLLSLHHNDGLPVDVILMLLQYAVSLGKSNMRYIETVGISWGKEEIDTIEKAEKKIKTLSKINKAWRKFESLVGIDYRSPTACEGEAVNRWYNDWGYSSDVIKEAYDICINANGKYVLKYIDSILSRWHESKILSLQQVRQERENRKNKISKVRRNPSYSIQEYENNYDIYEEIKWGEEWQKQGARMT